MRKVIRGASSILPDRVIREDLAIEDGKITSIGKWKDNTTETKVYDLHGFYVTPGFIDLQVNGGGGRDFGEGSPDAVWEAAKYHLQHGTTGLLATLITQDVQDFRRALESITWDKPSNVIGCHIEGPFIEPSRRGAHPPKYVRPPDLQLWNGISQGFTSDIKLVTLAPELPEARSLVRSMTASGIKVALGHSDATYDQALEAFREGVGLVTHLFNAMRGFHHREPGIIGAVLDSEVHVSLIADGIHVHPKAVRLLARCKGPDQMCLVTDAISAAGKQAGQYRLGSQVVTVADEQAKLSNGTLAGSLLTMDEAVRNALYFTELDLPDVVRMATLTPAQFLGIADRKGRLAEGYDADLVVLDSQLTVHEVFVGGESVYARNER